MNNQPQFVFEQELLKIHPNGNKKIAIPEGVTKIATDALEYCGEVEEFIMPSSMSLWYSEGIFNTCVNLKKVVFLKDSNGKKASNYFESCPALKSVVIGEGVFRLSERVFADCPSLKTVILPISLQEIEKRAFVNCPNLKTVIIPKNTKVAKNAIENCPNLQLIADDRQCLELSLSTDHSMPDYLEEPIFELGLCYLDNMRANGNKEIIIPEGVNVIEHSFGFLACHEVQTLIFPSTLMRIGDDVIKELDGLKKVIIPGSYKRIDDRAFAEVFTLEEVVLGEGIEEIGVGAFNCCKSLKTVILPSTLKKIDKGAFYNCLSLNSITLPKGIEYVSKTAFKNSPNVSISFEEGTPEEAINKITCHADAQVELYLVCNAEDEGANEYPFGEYNSATKIAIRKVKVCKSEAAQLLNQTLSYRFEASGGITTEDRILNIDELIFKDGKFFGILAKYHNSGDWTDGGVWLEEPYDVYFVLPIDKWALQEDYDRQQRVFKK